MVTDFNTSANSFPTRHASLCNVTISQIHGMNPLMNDYHHHVELNVCATKFLNQFLYMLPVTNNVVNSSPNVTRNFIQIRMTKVIINVIVLRVYKVTILIPMDTIVEIVTVYRKMVV